MVIKITSYHLRNIFIFIFFWNTECNKFNAVYVVSLVSCLSTNVFAIEICEISKRMVRKKIYYRPPTIRTDCYKSLSR